MKLTKKQVEEDMKFLLERSMKAGGISFTGDRDNSSNSIVGIAYGLIKLEDQVLPMDMDDVRSCENMWKKLPMHRKNAHARCAAWNACAVGDAIDSDKKHVWHVK